MRRGTPKYAPPGRTKARRIPKNDIERTCEELVLSRIREGLGTSLDWLIMEIPRRFKCSSWLELGHGDVGRAMNVFRSLKEIRQLAQRTCIRIQGFVANSPICTLWSLEQYLLRHEREENPDFEGFERSSLGPLWKVPIVIELFGLEEHPLEEIPCVSIQEVIDMLPSVRPKSKGAKTTPAEIAAAVAGKKGTPARALGLRCTNKLGLYFAAIGDARRDVNAGRVALRKAVKDEYAGKAQREEAALRSRMEEEVRLKLERAKRKMRDLHGRTLARLLASHISAVLMREAGIGPEELRSMVVSHPALDWMRKQSVYLARLVGKATDESTELSPLWQQEVAQALVAAADHKATRRPAKHVVREYRSQMVALSGHLSASLESLLTMRSLGNRRRSAGTAYAGPSCDLRVSSVREMFLRRVDAEVRSLAVDCSGARENVAALLVRCFENTLRDGFGVEAAEVAGEVEPLRMLASWVGLDALLADVLAESAGADDVAAHSARFRPAVSCVADSHHASATGAGVMDRERLLWRAFAAEYRACAELNADERMGAVADGCGDLVATAALQFGADAASSRWEHALEGGCGLGLRSGVAFEMAACSGLELAADERAGAHTAGSGAHTAQAVAHVPFMCDVRAALGWRMSQSEAWEALEAAAKASGGSLQFVWFADNGAIVRVPADAQQGAFSQCCSRGHARKAAAQLVGLVVRYGWQRGDDAVASYHEAARAAGAAAFGRTMLRVLAAVPPGRMQTEMMRRYVLSRTDTVALAAVASEGAAVEEEELARLRSMLHGVAQPLGIPEWSPERLREAVAHRRGSAAIPDAADRQPPTAARDLGAAVESTQRFDGVDGPGTTQRTERTYDEVPANECAASQTSGGEAGSFAIERVTAADARALIERIRSNFAVGADADERHVNLQNTIASSCEQLAGNLYSSRTHFVMELVQNADDNQYAPGVTPRLLIELRPEVIVVRSNETGFEPAHVNAICKIGESSKKNKEGFVGEKGIGFKSVFTVSDTPRIFSGPFRFMFDIRENKLGYVVPTVLDEPPLPFQCSSPSLDPELVQRDTGTQLELPLRPHTDVSAQLRSTLNPAILLFLRRLREVALVETQDRRVRILRVRPASTAFLEHSSGGARSCAALGPCDDGTLWSHEALSVFSYREAVAVGEEERPCSAEVEPASTFVLFRAQREADKGVRRGEMVCERYSLVLGFPARGVLSKAVEDADWSADELDLDLDEGMGNGDGADGVVRSAARAQRRNADSDTEADAEDENTEENVDDDEDLYLAADELEQQRVFAFLPLAAYGFRFIVQADFVLQSSRESVKVDSRWNRMILHALPGAVARSVAELVCSPLAQQHPVALCQYICSVLPAVGETRDFFRTAPQDICRSLERVPFLLSASGEWRTADRLMLPPRGVNADALAEMLSNVQMVALSGTPDVTGDAAGAGANGDLAFVHPKCVPHVQRLSRGLPLQPLDAERFVLALEQRVRGGGGGGVGVELKWLSGWTRLFVEVARMDRGSRDRLRSLPLFPIAAAAAEPRTASGVETRACERVALESLAGGVFLGPASLDGHPHLAARFAFVDARWAADRWVHRLLTMLGVHALRASDVLEEICRTARLCTDRTAVADDEIRERFRYLTELPADERQQEAFRRALHSLCMLTVRGRRVLPPSVWNAQAELRALSGAPGIFDDGAASVGAADIAAVPLYRVQPDLRFLRDVVSMRMFDQPDELYDACAAGVGEPAEVAKQFQELHGVRSAPTLVLQEGVVQCPLIVEAVEYLKALSPEPDVATQDRAWALYRWLDRSFEEMEREAATLAMSASRGTAEAQHSVLGAGVEDACVDGEEPCMDASHGEGADSDVRAGFDVEDPAPERNAGAICSFGEWVRTEAWLPCALAIRGGVDSAALPSRGRLSRTVGQTRGEATGWYRPEQVVLAELADDPPLSRVPTLSSPCWVKRSPFAKRAGMRIEICPAVVVEALRHLKGVLPLPHVCPPHVFALYVEMNRTAGRTGSAARTAQLRWVRERLCEEQLLYISSSDGGKMVSLEHAVWSDPTHAVEGSAALTGRVQCHVLLPHVGAMNDDLYPLFVRDLGVPSLPPLSVYLAVAMYCADQERAGDAEGVRKARTQRRLITLFLADCFAQIDTGSGNPEYEPALRQMGVPRSAQEARAVFGQYEMFEEMRPSGLSDGAGAEPGLFRADQLLLVDNAELYEEVLDQLAARERQTRGSTSGPAPHFANDLENIESGLRIETQQPVRHLLRACGARLLSERVSVRLVNEGMYPTNYSAQMLSLVLPYMQQRLLLSVPALPSQSGAIADAFSARFEVMSCNRLDRVLSISGEDLPPVTVSIGRDGDRVFVFGSGDLPRLFRHAIDFVQECARTRIPVDETNRVVRLGEQLAHVAQQADPGGVGGRGGDENQRVAEEHVLWEFVHENHTELLSGQYSHYEPWRPSNAAGGSTSLAQMASGLRAAEERARKNMSGDDAAVAHGVDARGAEDGAVPQADEEQEAVSNTSTGAAAARGDEFAEPPPPVWPPRAPAVVGGGSGGAQARDAGARYDGERARRSMAAAERDTLGSSLLTDAAEENGGTEWAEDGGSSYSASRASGADSGRSGAGAPDSEGRRCSPSGADQWERGDGVRRGGAGNGRVVGGEQAVGPSVSDLVLGHAHGGRGVELRDGVEAGDAPRPRSTATATATAPTGSASFVRVAWDSAAAVVASSVGSGSASAMASGAPPIRTVVVRERVKLPLPVAGERGLEDVLAEGSERTAEIGRAGERVAFEALGADARYRRCHWENEAAERGLPYDIRAEEADGALVLVEVKTTSAGERGSRFPLSCNEARLMFACDEGRCEGGDGTRVRFVLAIVRLTPNADQWQATVEEIANPVQSLSDRSLRMLLCTNDVGDVGV